jgi:NAD(P)-dependent dehydrogenase (short-subunit alcohol dehydrogenase family)
MTEAHTNNATSVSPGTLFSLEGKVAVVTGARGLLGRQHCLALALAGADVVATDLSQEKCSELAVELARSLPREADNRIVGLSSDVTRTASLHYLRDAVLEKFGKVDILVNNAAVNDMFESPAVAGELSKFENYPLEMWQRSIDVNVTGVFLCSQIIGAEIVRSGGGSIINIASTYGVVAPDQSLYRRPDGTQSFYKSAAYPVSKGAVLSFTRFLAAYWGGASVRVNALSPGGVENAQDDYFIERYSARTPLGRMASATDYQGALVFLASDASAYMTGANLVVDGGWTCW